MFNYCLSESQSSAEPPLEDSLYTSLYTSQESCSYLESSEAPSTTLCESCQLPRGSDFFVNCASWFHGNCIQLSLEDASLLVKDNQSYSCPKCLPLAPHSCPLCQKSFPPGKHNELWQHINRSHISQSVFPQPSYFVRYSRLICSSPSCHWASHRRFASSGCQRSIRTNHCQSPLVSPTSTSFPISHPPLSTPPADIARPPPTFII